MRNIRTYEEYITEAVRNGMLRVDLLAKYKENGREEEYREGFEKITGGIKGFTRAGKGMKAGDVIEFTAGYNDDIRYTTEILGFNSDGEVYVLWDCFWSPIRVDKVRDIKMVRKSK